VVWTGAGAADGMEPESRTAWRFSRDWAGFLDGVSRDAGADAADQAALAQLHHSGWLLNLLVSLRHEEVTDLLVGTDYERLPDDEGWGRVVWAGPDEGYDYWLEPVSDEEAGGDIEWRT
jgi:hypothetical protein